MNLGIGFYLEISSEDFLACKTNNPWWDEECSTWIKERRLSIDLFNKAPTLENYIKTKKSIAIVRKNLRNKKRQKFKIFCGSLNKESDVSYI